MRSVLKNTEGEEEEEEEGDGERGRRGGSPRQKPSIIDILPQSVGQLRALPAAA